MAFILGLLTGAGSILAIVGLVFVVKYDAYRKGYFDGIEAEKETYRTKIIEWRNKDEVEKDH